MIGQLRVEQQRIFHLAIVTYYNYYLVQLQRKPSLPPSGGTRGAFLPPPAGENSRKSQIAKSHI